MHLALSARRPARRTLLAALAAGAPSMFVGLADAAVINVPSAQAPTITVAINIASSGDEIVVAPGTYFESLSLNGKTLTLRSSDGPEVTIIDGLGQFQSVLRIISTEGPNTLVKGFTIRNGQATSAAPGDRGGGLYCNLTSPTIRDCVFVGNKAVSGGAFYANGGGPKLFDCVFLDNDAVNAAGDGGAMFLNNSPTTLTDCRFEGNASVRFGGAIRGAGNTNISLLRCSFDGNVGGSNGGVLDIGGGATPYVFRDCVFTANQCTGTGGAINIASANGVNHAFFNCLFRGNASTGNGGALNVIGRAELTNCTLVANLANGNGGAGITAGSGILVVRNGIVWANTPTGLQGSNLTVTYTCHQSAIAGSGNIVADPGFVHQASGDLRLTAESPCIDAGNTGLLPTAVATDLDGLPRAVNLSSLPTGVAAFGYFVDMGAFEFPASPTPSSCQGDLDGSGSIGAADLAILLGGWGPCD